MTTPGDQSEIPQTVAEVYEELRIEITWLHGRWQMYRELYAEGPKRIELLNESAGTFFYVVQELFLDEVQICLSKLTDPATTRGFENLSLEQLQQRLVACADPVLVAGCRRILNAIHLKCAAFRIRRHKTLAHLDLKAALGLQPENLPGISRQMVEDALSQVRDYMNAIEIHYNKSEWGFEHFIPSNGSAALLETLRAGNRYEELVQERKISLDDWLNGKWRDA